MLCSAYGKSSLYDGTEGELYDMNEDPGQVINLWDDPAYRVRREELVNLLEEKNSGFSGTRYARQAPV